MRISLLVVVSWLGSGDVPAAEPPPKAVATWAAGPMEVRVAFDRAVDPSVATGMVGGSVGFGEEPKPGKPDSAGRPGGDRGALRIASARLIDEGRTLVLVTDPHPREATYRLTLPGLKGAGQAGEGSRVELSYDLSGVEVGWAQGDGEKPSWSGWWPHVEPEASRVLLAGSAEHDRLWPMVEKPGRLTIRTLVVLPKGEAVLAIEAGSAFEVMLDSESAKSERGGDAHRATIKVESTGEAIGLDLTLETSQGRAPRLRVTTGLGEAPPESPLPRSAFVLSWAPPALPPAPTPAVPETFLTGGDPARGEVIFRGEQAKCANCHQVRGQGGQVGPDLTTLAGRDRAWVYQNIIEPSASIHPDYLSWTVAMKDGRIAMGVVRAEGADSLKVSDIDAKQTVIPRDEVEEIRPSASSIMPVGLLGALGEQGTRDLLAYLTAPGPPR
ncbi:c-type cytochrome [Tundrisphaera lichenicola]|uniref:c-type cytochrome n=1 Tax=Tundrisphaera lichenicola TaxID=2029860 RepID=UPI003EB6CA05